MQLGKRMRLTISWIICLMVLVGSFTSAARLKIGGDTVRSNWIEVCTASGMKFISLSQSDRSTSPKNEQGHHPSGHCAWCSAYSAALGMPPSPMLQRHVPVESRAEPVLFLLAPAPLFAWASAQPRAPPQLV